MNKGYWDRSTELESKRYTCGYCAANIVSNEGMDHTINERTYNKLGQIYICHHCGRPTYFQYSEWGNYQYPDIRYGDDVEYLPDEVKRMYDEARACMQVSAYNAVVLCCRKLLMNICVANGAEEGKSFVSYVTYLESNGYIPPNGRAWTDKIRTLGNDATHKIEDRTQSEAKMAIDFISMLMKFIYEFPNKI